MLELRAVARVNGARQHVPRHEPTSNLRRKAEAPDVVRHGLDNVVLLQCPEGLDGSIELALLRVRGHGDARVALRFLR